MSQFARILYSHEDRAILDFLRAHPDRVQTLGAPEDDQRVMRFKTITFLVSDCDDLPLQVLRCARERQTLYSALLEDAVLGLYDEQDRRILSWIEQTAKTSDLPQGVADSNLVCVKYKKIAFAVHGPIASPQDFARKTLAASRHYKHLREALLKDAA